ncbi:MAG: replicative DNA helicase [Planctomycetota bacterium]
MSEENLPGRIPPHNDEAEQALLGALLIEPHRIPEVAEFVERGDFFSRRHNAVYEALLALAERSGAIDLVSVGEALTAAGTFQEVGGRAYLVELSNCVTSAAHARHHARIVSETASLRGLIREASEILGEAYETRPDGDDVKKLLDLAETRIHRAAGGRDKGGAAPIGQAIEEAFRRIDSSSHRSGLTGLPTGYYELDSLLCGLNAGELIVLAARPSMGKTALALNILDHAALHPPEWLGRSPVVLFFSLEMGQQSIVRRMLCSRGRVDAHKLRTGKIPDQDYAKLAEAAGELSAARIFLDDSPGLTVMSMRGRARRLKAKQGGLDLIVVDYLQLMAPPRAENRQQEVSQISRALKDLSRELDVPVVALSQLSRAVELRDDKRPQLSDLRESGSIEQDADVVLLLFRPDYYEATDENRGVAELICAKQRNGPTGTVRLQFAPAWMRFENRAPGADQPFEA